jgi:arsenite methyltransferase
MPEYLQYSFTDSPETVSTFDELPLWSAAFGLFLLKHLEIRSNLIVVDIGSGAGFPLLELAERLGSSSRCYGIDPWANANNRAKQKIRNYGIKNAEVINISAEELPFENNYIDLAVSNLGINNFDNPGKVFKECNRVLKAGGKLALTTNLNGHWKEFYNIFEETLVQLKMNDIVPALTAHQEHRGTVSSVSELFTANGFTVSRTVEDIFEMTFANGTALLNHHFVKLGWLASWKDLIPGREQLPFFEQLEANLNAYALGHKALTLTVPMLFIEGTKVA